MKIGLISDTHSYMDDRILHHLEGCDLILHAGDVGDPMVITRLEKVAQTRGVYGNIDGTAVRKIWPEFDLVRCNGVPILMIHIAGAVGNYNARTRALIKEHTPQVLICGHSHILKVAQDQRFKLLHINPGAAGRHGFHKMRTLIIMEAHDGALSDLKVIELGPRSAKSVH